MEHLKTITNELTWHSPDGVFRVVLTNGQITELNFCASPEEKLVSTDFKYLKQVYQCLGELFAFIEAEDKKAGYTFANPDEH